MNDYPLKIWVTPTFKRRPDYYFTFQQIMPQYILDFAQEISQRDDLLVDEKQDIILAKISNEIQDGKIGYDAPSETYFEYPKEEESPKIKTPNIIKHTPPESTLRN